MPLADHVHEVELGHPLGRRVGVFGAGGKSTLARAIARKHDLEYIEIDAIQHMPEWRLRAPEDVQKIVLERMSSSPRGWVTDHNIPFILEHTDSVIILQLPFRTVFWRRLTRSLSRARTKELVCGGNTESFRQHLFTRDSAILEVWQKRKAYRRIGKTISRNALPGAEVFYLRTPGELDRFYKDYGLSRNARPPAD